jgi:hypothetical protein
MSNPSSKGGFLLPAMLYQPYSYMLILSMIYQAKKPALQNVEEMQSAIIQWF